MLFLHSLIFLIWLFHGTGFTFGRDETSDVGNRAVKRWNQRQSCFCGLSYSTRRQTRFWLAVFTLAVLGLRIQYHLFIAMQLLTTTLHHERDCDTFPLSKFTLLFKVFLTA